VRWQVFPVGVVLIALNSWWVMLGSEVWHSTQLTIASLFFNAVFALFLLVIGGGALRRIAPRLAPTRAEILVLYVMVVILTTISGHTMMGYLLPAMEHVYWFASPENDWPALFGHHLPGWLVVKDRDALRGYFEGDASLYTPRAMRAWAAPALAWTGIIVVLWTVLMLTAVLLRRQWTEHEKLTYPITQLPLALTADPVRFFKNRWMWLGFVFVASLDVWNGVAFLQPLVPTLPIKGLHVATFTTTPWRAMGGISVAFYPFVVGLMYFTPLDLSFSVWFFYILGRLWRVFVVAVGGQRHYGFEQSIGAWVAFGLIPLWLGRRWFIEMGRYIVTGGVGGRRIDTGEAVSYRVALIGVVSGVAILGVVWIAAGMSWWVFALYFAIYFPMVIGIARSRAEVGPPVHQVILTDPGRTLVAGMGTGVFGGRNLSMMTLLYPMTRCFRAHPMPSQLEALRIAERGGVRPRAMVIGMTLTTVVGTLITFWIYLHVLYGMGADNRARGWLVYMGNETYSRLQSWVAYPRPARPLEVIGMAGGFGITVLLMILKSRFLWFPFHPAGYVLTTGGGFIGLWFATFISWALKLLILRMGGVRTYRNAAPLFLGILLGDYTVGCVWSLIGLLWDMPTYGVWH
jgi:hypothetical protein